MSDKLFRMSRDLVREYLNYLRVEKGLAKNSLQAYERDLEKLSKWAEKNGFDLMSMDRRDLREWLIDLGRTGPGNGRTRPSPIQPAGRKDRGGNRIQASVKVMPLSRANEAIDRMRNREVSGGLVLESGA